MGPPVLGLTGHGSTYLPRRAEVTTASGGYVPRALSARQVSMPIWMLRTPVPTSAARSAPGAGAIESMLDTIPPRLNSGRTQAAKPAIAQRAMITNSATAQPGNVWGTPASCGVAWPGSIGDGGCASGGGATACGAPH